MNEDPTKDISQKYDTKPTMETVMEAINALGVELHSGLTGLRSDINRRFDGMDKRFDTLERKFNRLNKELLELKADHDGLDERVEKLEESKA